MRKPIFLTACLVLALSIAASSRGFTFSTGTPDGRMGTASRPSNSGLGQIEIESADDFILTSQTIIEHATFTGLLPSAAPLTTVQQVIVEIYRLFPLDSINPPSGHVPTRVNSPSDVAFDSRDSAAASLTFMTTLLNPSFTVANSVVNGINPIPNQTTGGEGPVNGEEVIFDVTFTKPFLLPAGHYFFISQVKLSSGTFLWLSAPKPIVVPGTPFSPDLQSWIRNADLEPDWLRIGTDIVGGSTPPTFNAVFSLSGRDVVVVASSDFDGDGLADKAVFRPGTGTFGTWYVKKSNGTGDLSVQWGASGDIPVAGNYAGDARADFAVFRPSDGNWWVLTAEGVSQPAVQWGTSGDVPVPGQYGGDTRMDFAVWRPSNGTWYVRTAEGVQLPSVQWGTAGDIPVPGDYDGDGITDMAVFRPSNGTWYVRFSGGPTAAIEWGTSGDIPVAADFTGNGRADYGIFRPSTGTWYIKSSANLSELPSVAWGAFGDVPLPSQMAGDSRADNVVWRPSDGNWYVRSAEGSFPPSVPWGTFGDIPLAR